MLWPAFDLTQNEKNILMQIYMHATVSRAHLVKLADQKKATLYRSVDALLKSEILLSRADTAGSGSPGRPSDLLSLNPKVGCFFSVTLWRDHCNLALMDFSGSLLDQISFGFQEIKTESNFYHLLKHHIHQMIVSYPDFSNRLLGISVATVGLLDNEQEHIQRLNNSEYPLLKKLYLPRYIREQYSVPSTVHNIVACAAIGYHAGKKRLHNMAYILIDSGIGVHVIIKGQSLDLKSSYTNGLGHMVVSLDGNRCECGSYGCLETYCSEKAIVRSVRMQLILGIDSKISRERIEQLTFRDVCNAAKEGDALCRHVIHNAAAIFLVGLQNFLNLLPMDVLVFAGSVPNQAPGFFEQIKESMKKQGSSCSLELDRNIQENINNGCCHVLLNQLLDGTQISQQEYAPIWG